MSEHIDYESKTVKVYGDKYAKEKNRFPAYERALNTRQVTFTCVTCGKATTQERYPGPLPQYCSDLCKETGTKLKTRQRVQQLRQRRKEEKKKD